MMENVDLMTRNINNINNSNNELRYNNVRYSSSDDDKGTNNSRSKNRT